MNTNYMEHSHVCLLGPVAIQYVKNVLYGNVQSSQCIEGGSCLANLVIARVSAGLPTDVITSRVGQEQHVIYEQFPLLRLWTIQRRSKGVVRDMFRQERIKIRAALRESEAVCLHAHWTYEYALAAHADPRPSTVTVHDHNMNILKYYGIRYLPQFIVWLYNVMLAKNVTAVSPYITKYVNRFRRKSDCVTIPNPLPEKACSRFVSSRADMGDGTVIMIGNEGELKNIKRGIQAFALFRLEHPSDRMIVIGKGLSPEGNIARWAAANKFARGITFTGEISYNDCLRYIRENKILLFPSLEESFGAPVQESLFLGTVPVGTTQARGVRWLIESCGGVLANGRDVRSLADGLMQARSFCQNEGELISMRRRIYKMASCEAVLSQYAKVYKRER